VTPNQVVAAYEKATGEKFQVTKTSLNRLRNLEQRQWAEGAGNATGITLRRIWAEGATLYKKNDDELIGMTQEKVESLDAAVRKLVRGNEDEL
jgi:hypothetical protein